LAVNERLIPQPLEHIQTILDNYRKHYIDECREKASTLSYRFLTNVYDRPRDPAFITESIIEHERDPRVRKLMLDCEDALKTTYERLSVVSESEVATWWYIFWVCLPIKNMYEATTHVDTGRRLEAELRYDQRTQKTRGGL
jgi:hypothetical protein